MHVKASPVRTLCSFFSFSLHKCSSGMTCCYSHFIDDKIEVIQLWNTSAESWTPVRQPCLCSSLYKPCTPSDEYRLLCYGNSVVWECNCIVMEFQEGHYGWSSLWKWWSTGDKARRDLKGPDLYSVLMHLGFSLKWGRPVLKYIRERSAHLQSG